MPQGLVDDMTVEEIIAMRFETLNKGIKLTIFLMLSCLIRLTGEMLTDSISHHSNVIRAIVALAIHYPLLK